MSPRTVFLGRLIGLYSILVSLSMITHKQATIEMVTAFLNNAPLLFLVGVMAVIPGLAMVLGHNMRPGCAFVRRIGRLVRNEDGVRRELEELFE